MEENTKCFVMMPFSDMPGYPPNYFKELYETNIKPAVEGAGFIPYKGDESNIADIVHIDIIQRLLNSEIAVCDISSGNPNVLFELGIRQALKKPTVIIKDNETKDIFDVGLLRQIIYEKDNFHIKVVEKFRRDLTNALKETYKRYRDNNFTKEEKLFFSLFQLIDEKDDSTLNQTGWLNKIDESLKYASKIFVYLRAFENPETLPSQSRVITSIMKHIARALDYKETNVNIIAHKTNYNRGMPSAIPWLREELANTYNMDGEQIKNILDKRIQVLDTPLFDDSYTIYILNNKEVFLSKKFKGNNYSLKYYDFETELIPSLIVQGLKEKLKQYNKKRNNRRQK